MVQDIPTFRTNLILLPTRFFLSILAIPTISNIITTPNPLFFLKIYTNRLSSRFCTLLYHAKIGFQFCDFFHALTERYLTILL